MKVRWPLIVVLLPIAVMAMWCAFLSLAIARATEVSLKVEGYDPRDLLRGHYLMYRVDYGFEPQNLNMRYGENGCVCLSVGDQGIARATWQGLCEDRNESTCPLFIKGRSEYGNFVAGIERYYFPEEYQQVLFSIPRDATIKVRITEDGSAYVRDMYVAGEPILEYARRNSSASQR